MILLTGGTGTTGSRLERFMRNRGAPVRVASRQAVGRDAARFDWADPATHAAALDGVDRISLVAPPGVADPLPMVEPFVRRAVERGVRRVVLLSSSAVPQGAAGLGELHRLVAETAPEWAVLQPSWFMQNFTGAHPVADGIRNHGEIVTATGAGRIAFVDAADIAAVAGHALLDATPHNTAHVITGPEPLSYAEAATIIAAVAGRPVRHLDVDVATLARHLTAAGYPPEFAAALAALDEGIRHGAEDRTTDSVLRITGRPPTSFHTFAAACPAAWSAAF